MRVCVGVHVYAEPDRLLATLRSLRLHTSSNVELLLLADGPDRTTAAALRSLADVRQSATRTPLGAPACFNRLVQATDADILVLLESGTEVGPAWLQRLLAAFEADRRNGLAGPSTNFSWNEQAVYRSAGGSPEEIARTADDAFARFGRELRLLEPLHSLADFCYAVRREVCERVGGADEGYGLGPCWEMDYNVRAHRSGFRAVWACASYVHRAPFTQRRHREESLRFDASRRLYQSKFCGGHLRGEKADFRGHCRGDACANFAPAHLIEITRPLPAFPDASEGNGLPTSVNRPVGGKKLIQQLQAVGPLVSCIMPTFNRRGFVPLAVGNFLRQDYTHKELIVLDDGDDSVRDLVEGIAGVRYERLGYRASIGAKRNLACELAQGPIVAHWDDDDWYPSWRLSAQVSALRNDAADVSGSSCISYYDAVADRAWYYRYAAEPKAWVAGSTFAYRRELWERNRFPEVPVGEDSLFLWNGPSKSVSDLNDPRLCVASLHSGNSGPKQTGGMFWHSRPVTEVHQLLGDDLHLYRAVFPPSRQDGWPLVSCILPTFNRRSFVPLAVRNFLHQDYPRKELIVVDDGDDPVGDLVEGIAGVRYERLGHRVSIGAKRNLACGSAQGQIIAHWDDDDWYAQGRLRYQVWPLAAGEADLTGLETGFVLELPAATVWTARPQLHRRLFAGDVHGGTLVYRRDSRLQYPTTSLAEDAALLHQAVGLGKRLLRLPNPGLFVYVRHGHNAWSQFVPGRYLDPAGWERAAAPATFTRQQLALYQQAAASL